MSMFYPIICCGARFSVWEDWLVWIHFQVSLTVCPGRYEIAVNSSAGNAVNPDILMQAVLKSCQLPFQAKGYMLAILVKFADICSFYAP